MTPTKTPPAPKEQAPEEYPMVRKSIVVDSRSTVRRLVRATPSTCLECGHNVMVSRDGEPVPPWSELLDEEKAQALAMLRRHIKKVHPNGVKNSAVVKEDEIERTWMAKPRPV